MAHLYLVPQWFFGFDIAMELVFAIIAMALAFFTYRIYKVSEDEDVKLFGLAFVLISISYIVWASINLFMLDKLSDGIREISLNNLMSINYILTLVHMGLFIVGIITLAYAHLEIKSAKAYYILTGLALIGLVSSSIPWITYQLLAIFLLSTIVYHYAVDHSCYKNKKARAIFIAFLLLLLSRIDFLFTANSAFAYIFGHILELTAYSLILVGLVANIKGCKK